MSDSLLAPEQPKSADGKPWGRPRGDARIVAVLGDTWTPLPEIVDRLGLSKTATQKALYRATRRGVIEHRKWVGYRRRGGGA